MKQPRMETCYACGGAGLRAVWDGDYSIVDCRSCGGSGQVEARDESGRFLPWVEVEDQVAQR